MRARLEFDGHGLGCVLWLGECNYLQVPTISGPSALEGSEMPTAPTGSPHEVPGEGPVGIQNTGISRYQASYNSEYRNPR